MSDNIFDDSELPIFAAKVPIPNAMQRLLIRKNQPRKVREPEYQQPSQFKIKENLLRQTADYSSSITLDKQTKLSRSPIMKRRQKMNQSTTSINRTLKAKMKRPLTNLDNYSSEVNLTLPAKQHQDKTVFPLQVPQMPLNDPFYSTNESNLGVETRYINARDQQMQNLPFPLPLSFHNTPNYESSAKDTGRTETQTQRHQNSEPSLHPHMSKVNTMSKFSLKQRQFPREKVNFSMLSHANRLSYMSIYER